jgi:enamine deaminase RidA (YjgF/YER057c/UK114 family)
MFALLALACALAATAGSADRKKKKEQDTQTLQLPKELPNAVVAETRRLVFHVSPLSGKGLLSQQVRDALKALLRSAGSSSIVKLRAFVAGSGDLRRARDLVSETFAERRQNLPVLSLVQVGGLPLEGAQVVIESIAVSKKEVNPDGLVFISGQAASSEKPLDPLLPLAEKSLANLRAAVKAAGSEPADMLRVTCFLSSLDNVQAVRTLVASEYHRAALNYVQIQRAPTRAIVECEAVARLRWNTGSALHLLSPKELPQSPQYSQIALVRAPRVALTGTQVSFGYQDSDARLAFQRLEKALRQAGASIKDVAMSSVYPLSASLAEQARKIRFEFYDKSRPPASTMLPFEGLPSMEAGFAVDVVAVVKGSP